MMKQRQWYLWVKDGTNKNLIVFIQYGSTARIAYDIARAKDEYKGIQTKDYVLVRAMEIAVNYPK